LKHEAPFRPSNPSKKGYNRTLAKFPEYIPQKETQPERRRPTSEGPKKENFRFALYKLVKF
jgi:hypothetical protein